MLSRVKAREQPKRCKQSIPASQHFAAKSPTTCIGTRDEHRVDITPVALKALIQSRARDAGDTRSRQGEPPSARHGAYGEEEAGQYARQTEEEGQSVLGHWKSWKVYTTVMRVYWEFVLIHWQKNGYYTRGQRHTRRTWLGTRGSHLLIAGARWRWCANEQ